MAEELRYTTVRAAADAEFEEKRSIFIGHASPVTNEQEALDFLARIRSEYTDAKHNVYAYVLRENNTARYSDDREPQGTAGLPVLDVLRKAEIVDTAVVVTRYFGGTLLGTGGLVRAYTKAARMAVEAAGIVVRARLALLSLKMNYSDYQKVQPILSACGARIDDSAFTGDVTLSVSLLYENSEELAKRLQDACGGRVDCRLIGECFDYL